MLVSIKKIIQLYSVHLMSFNREKLANSITLLCRMARLWTFLQPSPRLCKMGQCFSEAA